MSIYSSGIAFHDCRLQFNPLERPSSPLRLKQGLWFFQYTGSESFSRIAIAFWTGGDR
jgi:hypothetical protein